MRESILREQNGVLAVHGLLAAGQNFPNFQKAFGATATAFTQFANLQRKLNINDLKKRTWS